MTLPSFQWGHIGGEHTWIRSSGGAGGKVIRQLPEEFEYVAPPLGSHGAAWQRRGESLEMPWDSPNPQQTVTLAHLANLLQTKRESLQNLPPDVAIPKEVRHLDLVADKLLEIAEHLHERRCGIGFATLHNVLLDLSREGEVRIVLPDLGFLKPSRAMMRPKWVKALDTHRTTTFPDLQTVENVLNRGVVQNDFDPTPDIRALGRLFIYAISGKSPETIQNEIASKQRSARSYQSGLWNTLHQAVRGDIKSVGDFRHRLEATPLSQNFVRRRSNDPPPRPRLVPFVVLLVGLGAGIAGYMYRDKLIDLWSTGTSSDLTSGDVLKRLEDLKGSYVKTPPENKAEVVDEAVGLPLSKDPDLRARELKIKTELLQQHLENWHGRILDVWELAQEPRNQVEAINRARALRDELKILETKLSTAPGGELLLPEVTKCSQEFDQSFGPQLGL